MLDNKTKARIAQEAKAHWLKTSGDQGELDYIAGAEAEADRNSEFLKSVTEAFEAMEGKYWHVAKSLLREALTKYNNPVNK